MSHDRAPDSDDPGSLGQPRPEDRRAGSGVDSAAPPPPPPPPPDLDSSVTGSLRPRVDFAASAAMVNDILSVAPGDETTGHRPPTAGPLRRTDLVAPDADTASPEPGEGDEAGSAVTSRSSAEGGRTIHQAPVSADFFTASKSKSKSASKSKSRAAAAAKSKKRFRRGR